MLPITRDYILAELERLYGEARKVQDSMMERWPEPYQAHDTSGKPLLLSVLETQARILDILERMSSVRKVVPTMNFTIPERCNLLDCKYNRNHQGPHELADESQNIHRSPEYWCTFTGIRVLDMDGWRNGVPNRVPPRPWGDSITLAEFQLRASASTTDHPQ